MKGELTDDESFAGLVENREIHFAFVVIEHAHLTDFSNEPIDVFLTIGFLDSQQNEEAMVDSGYRFIVDGNGCFGDSLKDDAHEGGFAISESVSSDLASGGPGLPMKRSKPTKVRVSGMGGESMTESDQRAQNTATTKKNFQARNIFFGDLNSGVNGRQEGCGVGFFTRG